MERFKNHKGAVMTLFAILLPVLLGCTGMAVDLGRLYMEKARLQNIADAAVLAGITELKENIATKDLIDKETCQLVNTMPIGALSFNSSLSNTHDSKSLLSIANEGADNYLKMNSGNLFQVSPNHNETGEEVVTALYRIKNSEKSLSSGEDKYTYYYELIVRNDYPLFFAKIIYPHDTMRVRAGALAKFEDLVVEAEPSLYEEALAAWGKMDRDELLALDSAARLKADQNALANLGSLFINKSKSEIKTMLNITNDNWFTQFADKGIFFGNYFDNNDTPNVIKTDYKQGATNKMIGNNMVDWLQGKTDDPNLNFSSGTRYFFSDHMVKTKNEIDPNMTTGGNPDEHSIRLSFHFEGDVVTDVRIRVNRGSSSGDNNKSYYSDLDIHVDENKNWEQTVIKDSEGNTIQSGPITVKQSNSVNNTWYDQVIEQP